MRVSFLVCVELVRANHDYVEYKHLVKTWNHKIGKTVKLDSVIGNNFVSLQFSDVFQDRCKFPTCSLGICDLNKFDTLFRAGMWIHIAS